MIYLFTRNPDGSVVSSGYYDLAAAHIALQTYCATSRKFGYRVEPAVTTDAINERYDARNGDRLISFWLSDSPGSPVFIPPGSCPN